MNLSLRGISCGRVIAQNLSSISKMRRLASKASGGSHSNLGTSSLDIFQQNWNAYKDIVASDYMEHRSMTKSMTGAIQDFLKKLPESKLDTLDVVDVGCGDLALLAPLYRNLPIRSFCGVDLSLPALELANKAFHGDDKPKDSPRAPASFVHQDILQWANMESGADIATDGSLIVDYNDKSKPRKFDIIISSLVVHHLDDEKKCEFLTGTLKNRLKPGGVMLMMDVFRKDGEGRDIYLERYRKNIASWVRLPAHERESILEHVVSSDFPASISDFMQSIVPKSGAIANIIWSDSGDFEKLMVIKPQMS